MKDRKKILAMSVLVLISAAAMAQNEGDEELEARMREAEARLQEQEAEMQRATREAEREREARRAEIEAARAEAARQAERERRAFEAERAEALREVERVQEVRHAEMEAREAEIAVRMREAEAALAEAAQQVADLSMQQLPRVAEIERQLRIRRGPVLGITIGGEAITGDTGADPVEGVAILGVTPGGAAAEAGLRTGDVITSVNGESLTADSARASQEKLLDFMHGVEEGDVLDVEYLRNGRTSTVELAPRGARGGMYAFNFDGKDFTVPHIQVAPGAPGPSFVWNFGGHAWGDMELVSLTEDLGRYFGTDEGLLVVRAPEDDEFKLEDGDVIQSIDGRRPTSVAHAMRILGSYQGGETLEIEIMRNKRRQTLKIEMPDDRQSFAAPEAPDVDVRVMPAGKVIVRQTVTSEEQT